jgi:hypothetical protein
MKETKMKEFDTLDPATNTVGPIWLDETNVKGFGDFDEETGCIILGPSKHYDPNQTKLDDFAKYAEKFPELQSAQKIEADVAVQGLDNIVFPYVALVDGNVTAIVSDDDVSLVTKFGKTYARQVHKPVNFYNLNKGFVGSAFPR